MIENYTHKRYAIRVICTAKSLNEENKKLFTTQFSNVFKTIINIPLIDKVSINNNYIILCL